MDYKTDMVNLSAYNPTQKREVLVYLCKVAEGSEQFNDMCNYMRELIKLSVDLTSEEQTLFSVAFKNAAGALRSAYRSVEPETRHTAVIVNYQRILQDRLRTLAEECVGILTGLLQSPSISNKDRVLYYKLKGDFCRYIAEMNPAKSRYSAWANDSYKQADSIAKQSLPTNDSVRLSLALNWSVCIYEILKEPKQAGKVATAAFDGAINELDELNEQEYMDATLILQLIRDNIILWQNARSA
jgi:14-3-3 protein epsilon